jgi:hypothetical protein
MTTARSSIVVLLLVGCTNRFGEGNVPIVPEGFDGSAPSDSFDRPPPTAIFDSGFPESEFFGDTLGSVESRTTGRTCTTDDDCDTTGAGINICTNGAFGGDSLYPTSVCIGRECDPGGVAPVRCDGFTGVCLPVTGGGICLPQCFISNSTSPPKGCAGKNLCRFHAFSAPESIGVGFCFGGCTVNADCPTGQLCQAETALCTKTVDVYTKKVGDPCTDADIKKPQKCNCYLGGIAPTPAKAGYCTLTCRAGVDPCPSGFVCDPELPVDRFTSAPEGLGGSCLKFCTTDSDCTGLNAKCTASGGLMVKTCKVSI